MKVDLSLKGNSTGLIMIKVKHDFHKIVRNVSHIMKYSPKGEMY